MTINEQMIAWLAGDSKCPNDRRECCPDFSCCRPHLAWPLEKRQRYAASGQEVQTNMLYEAIASLMADIRKDRGEAN